MADDKPQLARDGTMDVTAKEGIAFLAANNFAADDAPKESEEATPKVPRDNTMVNTAKEGAEFLAANNFKETPQESDEDAVPEKEGEPDEKTEEITNNAEEDEEAPPAKKSRKQAKAKKPVVKKPVEKKAVEKKPVPVEKKVVEKKPVEKKPVVKRTSTMAQVAEEAKKLYGKETVDVTSGRQTRSGGRRPPPPPPTKKATGGAKRGRKAKAAQAESDD